ncbi:hypothetical protein CDEST_05611 [Colletotrichum destructivum]|uniref:Uncharacterized protein n=1 Tax=Colletotrichum destructivum TaxID=34406 RepID=A0AAX4IBJ1_9PEZI|nr:hypothetical protein CDEST_05611 [Colletotrichum destructivum]
MRDELYTSIALQLQAVSDSRVLPGLQRYRFAPHIVCNSTLQLHQNRDSVTVCGDHNNTPSWSPVKLLDLASIPPRYLEEDHLEGVLKPMLIPVLHNIGKRNRHAYFSVPAAPFQCALNCVPRSRRHLPKHLEPIGAIRIEGVASTFGVCHPSSQHIFQALLNGL